MSLAGDLDRGGDYLVRRLADALVAPVGAASFLLRSSKKPSFAYLFWRKELLPVRRRWSRMGVRLSGCSLLFRFCHAYVRS